MGEGLEKQFKVWINGREVRERFSDIIVGKEWILSWVFSNEKYVNFYRSAPSPLSDNTGYYAEILEYVPKKEEILKEFVNRFLELALKEVEETDDKGEALGILQVYFKNCFDVMFYDTKENPPDESAPCDSPSCGIHIICDAEDFIKNDLEKIDKFKPFFNKLREFIKSKCPEYEFNESQDITKSEKSVEDIYFEGQKKSKVSLKLIFVGIVVIILLVFLIIGGVFIYRYK